MNAGVYENMYSINVCEISAHFVCTYICMYVYVCMYVWMYTQGWGRGRIEMYVYMH